MIFLLFLASVIGLRLILSKDPAAALDPAVALEIAVALNPVAALEIAIEPLLQDSVLQNTVPQNTDLGSDLSHLASALQQWGAPTAPSSPAPTTENLTADPKSVLRPS